MDELNENVKPPSWVDELAELIAKKRAENELLKKVREAICNSGGEQSDTSGADVENKEDITSQDHTIN